MTFFDQPKEKVSKQTVSGDNGMLLSLFGTGDRYVIMGGVKQGVLFNSKKWTLLKMKFIVVP